MKKQMLCAAALGAGAAACSAQNMTIYGLMDGGIRYVKGGGMSKAEQNYGTPPRLGFRGTEDLGGGLGSFFVLEMGLNSDTGTLGQNGRAFGRQSLVGIRQETMGALILGRGYDSMVDYLQPLSMGGQTWAGGLGAHWGDIDNVNNYFRVQNMLKYVSRDWNGFKFGGHYSFGETGNGTRKNGSYSLGATYAGEAVRIGAAYMNVNSPITSVFDGNNNGSFQSGSPYIGTQTADRLKTFGIGGTYSFSERKARLGVLYTHTDLANSVLTQGDATYQNLEFNAQFNLTTSLQLGAGYNYTVGRLKALDQQPTFHQVNVGAVYSLSKTTSIYAQLAYQRAAGDARYAAINLLPTSTGRSQTVSQLAVRVIF